MESIYEALTERAVDEIKTDPYGSAQEIIRLVANFAITYGETNTEGRGIINDTESDLLRKSMEALD